MGQGRKRAGSPTTCPSWLVATSICQSSRTVASSSAESGREGKSSLNHCCALTSVARAPGPGVRQDHSSAADRYSPR